MDRSDGDYWLYEAEMDYEEGITVTGNFRYEFEREDSLTIGSETHEVCVMKVTGTVSGQTEEFLGMSASVEIVFNGYSYDLEGSMATVKEDMYTWANLTFETDLMDITTRTESQDVTTYSPPLLSGFVDGETGTGDEWLEMTNVSTTSTAWEDGVIDSTYSDEYVETYFITIAPAEETVTTDAGTFTCLRITSTDGSDDYVVYWYSSEVGAWVRMSSYSMGDETPYLNLELVEYSHGGLSTIMILLIVGVIVIVVVVLVALLLMRRRRTPIPQQMPPPPPPTV